MEVLGFVDGGEGFDGFFCEGGSFVVRGGECRDPPDCSLCLVPDSKYGSSNLQDSYHVSASSVYSSFRLPDRRGRV